LKLGGKMLVGAAGGALTWTAVFLLFGVIAGLFTGDWSVTFPLGVFGAVAGVLFGIGDVISELITKRKERPRYSFEDRLSGLELLGCLAALLAPPLKIAVLVWGAVGWLTTKDFRRQAPGRGRRALVGAVALGGMAALAAVFLFAFVPPPPGGLQPREAALGVGMVTLIGALLGMLSDDW
jgi:hypothetical protein